MSEEKAIALGVAIGRRQAAEHTAALLRSVLASWSQRIASRGPLVGPLLAGMTRAFAEELSKHAAAIEAGLAVMQAEERRLRADLEAAKAAPSRPWWKR